ncbi:unnamed protein product [Tetraodon nigroviridis]|uniref:Chromosome 6 SCAF14737, whole genome shotgun sequence n=1 Tax=Tetraodon nigroviridis TaxID=99883 RepID=Q4S4Y0_TETNG|nr:unnamed protein product [Tetraodon nigroviridis]
MVSPQCPNQPTAPWLLSGRRCQQQPKNMLEIAPNPTETWELCSREGRVAVWNQQEPTRHLKAYGKSNMRSCQRSVKYEIFTLKVRGDLLGYPNLVQVGIYSSPPPPPPPCKENHSSSVFERTAN